MKTFTALAVFVLLAFGWGRSDGQTWEWARQALQYGDGGNDNEAWGVATDKFGNIYEPESFVSDTIIFGSDTLFNSSGASLAFVKYDSSGNALWAKSSGGTSGVGGVSVAIDTVGNIFLSALFYPGTLILDSITLINSTAYAEIFIAKYDSSGGIYWAKSANPTGPEQIWLRAIATDHEGNTYITGGFGSPTLNFGANTVTNTGLFNIYVAKYDPQGNALWAKSGTGSGNDNGYDVATDNAGNIYVTGFFGSPILSFDSYNLYNTSNDNDAFVVKYDSNGNAIWAKSTDGLLGEGGLGIATDHDANIFISGYFNSLSFTFDTITINKPTTGPNFDIFLAKFDSSGNILWCKIEEADQAYKYAWDVATDPWGNCYMCGGSSNFIPILVFGTDTLYEPNDPADMMFVLKFDPSGNFLCGDLLQSGGDDASGITIDVSGNAYVAGDFNSDPFIIGNNSLFFSGGETIFLAKWKCPLGNVATGIEALNPPSTISIFPNPFTTSTTITLTSEGVLRDNYSTPFNVQLFDELGREAPMQYRTSQPGNRTTITIDRGALLSGMYFVSITSKEKREVVKLVIE